MENSRFKIISPADLEDYRDQAADISEASWPEFLIHDSVANENWHELFDRFSEYQFAMFDTEKNCMAAMGATACLSTGIIRCRISPKAAGTGSS